MEYKPNKKQLRYTSNKPPRDYRDIDYDYKAPMKSLEEITAEPEKQGSVHELEGEELERALQSKADFMDWYEEAEAKEDQAIRIQELLDRYEASQRDKFRESGRDFKGSK